MRATDTGRLTGPARLAAAGVTAREQEILDAIGRRLANPEIAARMHISVRTVESHVSALLRKTGLTSRSALVELAQQLPGEQAVPIPTTSLVGRDSDLAALAGLLASAPLVTLTGPAGAGKTRLALAAARAWPGEARLADLTPATADGAAALIAAGLGIGYEARDLTAAARVALAGRSLLLVADNCEHVLAAAADVLDSLVSTASGLRVLATSREPLGIGAERVYPVEPLPLPAGRSPADVRASAAGRLFLDRAQAASPGFRLDETSAPQVADICARLDGLPLAIELAAARIRTLDAAELAEGLRNRLGVLERPGRAGRHESLASAIDWSWRLLTDAERGLLRRLAALPGEFTLPLAEAAGTAPTSGPGSPAGPDSADGGSPAGPDGAEVRPLLLRLVDQSLVTVRRPAGEPARYRLLAVIRAFALEHAAPVADEQVLRAHARFFESAAADAVRSLWQARPPAPSPPRFDEPNLLAALAWSAGHDAGLADRLLISISQLVEAEPSRHALQTIGDLAGHRPPDWSSEALARACQVVCYLSLEQAAQLARQSSMAAATGRDRAFAGLASGWVRAYRYDEAAARRQLDPVLSYARRAGEPWLEASALQACGVAGGSAAAAFADLELAATRFVAAGDLMHAQNVRYMLASRALEAGTRLDDVPVWLDGCESFAASHGLTHELAHIRRTRAGYLLIRDQPAAALELLEAAMPVFRQAGDFRCVARTLADLARPALTADPAAQADFLLGALGAAAIASGPPLQAQVLTALTGAAAGAGDLVLAARCLGALQAIAGEAPDGPGPGRGVPRVALDRGLQQALGQPAYATFVSEGQEGGIGLITALYPR
jgi:predicted ATPase/DNA-binding CsgD family transcriptional regulator